MSKKYVIYVDERGFLSTDISNNFSMIGVIFEYDYCIDLKDKKCELKTKLNQYKEDVLSNNNLNVFLDDIILKEKVLEKIDETKRKKIINELPSLLKSLKFTIISSSIKQDSNNIKESYSIVTNDLLKSFYSFIIKKNGEFGGIIIEARDCKANYILQQSFFDIYNERSRKLSMLEGIQDKINTFIVTEKGNKIYGLGIELLNILNNIIFRVSNEYEEIENKLMPYIEYGNTNKILNTIKHKVYKDTPIQISTKHVQNISYNSTEMLNKELKILKKQLNLQDKKINEKEKEINELSNEIQLLNQQLEAVLLSRKSDSIVFQILSDIDFKMKRIEKKTTIAQN